MLASIFILTAGIAALIIVFGWARPWAWLAVLQTDRPFHDLRTIQAAISAVDAGLDPRLDNPGDPDGRPMNYPWLWVWIARVLGLDQDAYLYAFGGAMTLGFLIAMTLLPVRYPSWLWLPALASTTVFSVIALGNNDMLIFVMVMCAASVGGRPGLLLVGAATALKLYPLALLASNLWAPRQLLPALFIFAVALGLSWHDVQLVISATPQPAGWAYGAKTIALATSGLLPWWAISLSTCALAAVLAWHPVTRRALVASAPEGSPHRLMAAGSAIYVATFLVNANWDYRLIFLLLVLPWTLCQAPGKLRLVLLPAILIAMNETLLVRLTYPGGYILTLVCELVLANILLAWLLKTSLQALGIVDGDTTRNQAQPSTA
ncbi:MAG: hypothetical protein ACK4XK_11075 [Casimicrobiaceae bacterium]